jgi:hypothetical protein
MSASEKTIQCPHCRKEIDPDVGEHCPRCARPLAAPPAPSPAGNDSAGEAEESAGSGHGGDVVLRGLQEMLRKATGQATDDPGVAFPPAGAVRTPDARPSVPSARPSVEVRPAAPVAAPAGVRPYAAAIAAQNGWTPAGPLLVEYNFARVFMVGQVYPFQFRFRATAPGTECVAICLRGTIGENRLPSDEKVECPFDPNDPDGVSWDVNFHPTIETPGEPAVRIYIGCRQQGETAWKWFYANVRHKIYAKDAGAGEVAKGLILNIQNNVSIHGHANDAKTSSTIDDLRKFADENDSGRKGRDLVDFLATREVFLPLSLKPFSPPDPVPEFVREVPVTAPPSARCDRLTLEHAGVCVQVIGRSHVQFGKHRQNDLVLRVFRSGGKVDEARTVVISKFHGAVRFTGDRCTLHDAAREPGAAGEKPSAYGTMFDGERLPAGGSAELPPGRKVAIALSPGSDFGKVLELEAEAWQCQEGRARCPHDMSCHEGAPACVVLRRRDSLPERYALLWRCVPLSRLFPGAGEGRLCRRDGGFWFQPAGGRGGHWIEPGGHIESPAGAVAVREFAQTGL